MVKHVDPQSVDQIGQRLMWTRQALGYTTTKMCQLMGSSSNGSAYSNYEVGRRRISLDHALALCSVCGLTLAWIYQGNDKDLPPDLREKIRSQRTSLRRS